MSLDQIRLLTVTIWGYIASRGYLQIVGEKWEKGYDFLSPSFYVSLITKFTFKSIFESDDSG